MSTTHLAAVGVAGFAAAAALPPAVASWGTWYRFTMQSEEADASSCSWKGQNCARQTQCVWPPSSSNGSGLPPPPPPPPSNLRHCSAVQCQVWCPLTTRYCIRHYKCTSLQCPLSATHIRVRALHTSTRNGQPHNTPSPTHTPRTSNPTLGSCSHLPRTPGGTGWRGSRKAAPKLQQLPSPCSPHT